MELKVIRTSFTATTTIGGLFIENGISIEKVCLSLEDARRAPGIKVQNHTCIPAGRYRVTISYSSRFKREMPMIYNCANGYEIRAEGITFTGIRIHGGNTHENTAGCLIVAYNYINENTIQGTAEEEVTHMIRSAIAANEEVWIEFEDKAA